MNRGGLGGDSKALTKTYDPTVKNTLEMMSSTHVADSSNALRLVSTGTLNIVTDKSMRGITAMNAESKLPQTYHLLHEYKGQKFSNEHDFINSKIWLMDEMRISLKLTRSHARDRWSKPQEAI